MAIVIDGIEYLDGDEAARLLGVKKATLYAYVSRGIVQSYRQGVGRHQTDLEGTYVLVWYNPRESMSRLDPVAATATDLVQNEG